MVGSWQLAVGDLQPPGVVIPSAARDLVSDAAEDRSVTALGMTGEGRIANPAVSHRPPSPVTTTSHDSPTTNHQPRPMTDIRQHALDCREAARAVALPSTDARNAMLRAMADELLADAPAILAANADDLAAARDKGVGDAMLDRLRLDDARLAGIADALREVAALPDPVGQVTRRETRPN